MSRVQEIRDKYKVLIDALVENINFFTEDELRYGFKARTKEYFEGIISPEKKSLIASAYTTLVFTYHAIYAVGRGDTNSELHARLHELEANLLEQLENDNIFLVIKTIYENNAQDKKDIKDKIGILSHNVTSNEYFITTCHRYQYSINYEFFAEEASKASKIYEDIRKEKQLINGIKMHIDKMFEQSGITRFSTDFGKIESEEYTAQKWWLGITAVIGCIIVALSAYSMWQIFSSAPLETILYKLPFVFSFLLISVWTGHKYSIARKNRITYRHLATTLATYNTFNDAIKGDEQKNLLLFEIAKVLFTPPISNQSENQKEMANTIDLLKTITSSNLLKGLNSSESNNTRNPS